MKRRFGMILPLFVSAALFWFDAIPAVAATPPSPAPSTSGAPTLIPIASKGAPAGAATTAQDYPDCVSSYSSAGYGSSNNLTFESWTQCSMNMTAIYAKVCYQHQWGFWWWQWTGDVQCKTWTVDENNYIAASGWQLNPGSGCYRAHGYHFITPPPGYYCSNGTCAWDEVSNTVCH